MVESRFQIATTVPADLRFTYAFGLATLAAHAIWPQFFLSLCTVSKPSFLSLFKRGRYSRALSLDEGDSSKTEQLERFTAAALAFCFRHDKTFQQHFWERICRLNGDPATPDSLTIELEPRQSADLLVRSVALRQETVHVIECKVGAPLYPHQNPTEPKFSEPGGYGFQLIQHKGSHSGLRYVVLGFRENLKLPERHPSLPIQLKQRYWRDLDSLEPTSSLMEDLFDFLGEVRIGNFHMRKTIKLAPISTGLQSIGDAFSIINDTLQNFGIEKGYKIEVRPGGHVPYDAGWIGAYIPCGANAGLQKATQPRWGYLGWLGYYTKADGAVRRSVSLYCTDAERAQSLKTFLSSDYPNAATGKEEDQDYVVINDESVSGLSDVRWFSGVLEKTGRLATAK